MFIAYLMAGISVALPTIDTSQYPEIIVIIVNGAKQFFGNQIAVLATVMANNFMGYGIYWLTKGEKYDYKELVKTIAVFETVTTPMIVVLHALTPWIPETQYFASAVVWLLWMLKTFYKQITA